MNNLHNRIKQLETQQQPQVHTWKDLVTGAWEPSPQEWASFLALQKPSDIAAYADELILQGHPATPEQRAAIESIKQATQE